ncbi:MAG: IgA Peptidase M64 [Clostridiales bacterium]|nr:IgA Peptidase M64 [Clostridiales bacterium]
MTINLRNLLISALLSSGTVYGSTDTFNSTFCDSTLRVDYVLAGGPSGNAAYLSSQSMSEGWAGRRKRLDEVPLEGNGHIDVKDPVSGRVLYTQSFSTLYQEWLHTPEAAVIPRSFENSFLVPLPKDSAIIELTLNDNRRQPMLTMRHLYRPDDELVRKSPLTPHETRYIHRGTNPAEAIDVAILAEGFTPDEADEFFKYARIISDEILSYEPFKSYKDKFNFVAVMSPSVDSGVSVPLDGTWRNTAFDSHYSTFYSSRYLTVPSVKKMHDALNGIPYEHVLVLVNTERYGGGGIYNCYQVAATRNEHTLPVAVHEFGHSFGGLADEYFYINELDDTYPIDIEPWEPNITTLVDFDSKWKSMITPGTEIPTDGDVFLTTDGKPVVGVFEGGGYKAKGVFRPVMSCRMRDNNNPVFCPVCRAAIQRVIEFYTK